MPKLTGVFDYFKFLDKIPGEDIRHWVKTKVDVATIRNFLGNRILYPQTLATTTFDLEMDLAILKEGLGMNAQQFYSPSSKKIILPKVFLSRFPKTTELMASIVHSIKFSGLTSVYLNENAGNILAGSIFVPQRPSKNMTYDIEINGQVNHLKLGTLVVFPIFDHNINIKTPDGDMVVNGGVLGFALDLRLS